jgi:hypothetical protein
MSNIPHPLQGVFNMADTPELDIEKDYAMTEVTNQPPHAQGTVTQLEAPPDVKDDDDKLVEKRIDEVYDTAMAAYHNQSAFIEIVDPKFAARNAEVAANYLNIALAAANSRANVKRDRKRANQTFIPYGQPGGKTTNNFVVADRNQILKMMTLDTEDKKV